MPTSADAPTTHAVTLDFPTAVTRIRSGDLTVDDVAGRLLEALTDEERLWLLDGDQRIGAGLIEMGLRGYNTRPIVAGAVERLGIPGIRFTDGPRGVVVGRATCFPVAMARGATWDVDLEEEVGRAMGRESRALGANLFAGVCINVLRHPAWGRAQETYGEDPVHLGAMGAAVTRGVRSHVMACVKHYACNSIENARFKLDVEVDEAALHEVYLPHFRDVVRAGAESVMSAYNSVNGEWAGENHTLLTAILRDEWGFDGFVMSDFVWGLRNAVASVGAGLDLEMPFRQQRAAALPAALADGRLDRADVDRACRRLLATQLRHAAGLSGPAPATSVVACESHRRLARRAAADAMVLLRNEGPLLPLAPDLTHVAVIGRLATHHNTGDGGSSRVRPPSTCPPLEGIRGALPDAVVEHHDGTDPTAAAAAARRAEVAVVVVGSTTEDEGESMVGIDAASVALVGGIARNRLVRNVVPRFTRRFAKVAGFPGGDRSHLTLRPSDETLVRAVAAANPNTVVVVIGGSIPVIEAWRDEVPAILLAWYPGMEGGHALADVLLGVSEPGGRLPAAMAADDAHLPHFDPDATRITYDRWWGQRKLDRDGNAAAYPLGFGLGYTAFRTDHLAVEPTAGEDEVGAVRARVGITNIGDRDGATVVQLYAVVDDPGLGHRPHRQLLGFTKVRIPAGTSAEVEVHGTLRPLYERDAVTHTWTPVAGRYRIEAARFSGDPDAATTTFEPAASSATTNDNPPSPESTQERP